jgi:hypothetical protein
MIYFPERKNIQGKRQVSNTYSEKSTGGGGREFLFILLMHNVTRTHSNLIKCPLCRMPDSVAIQWPEWVGVIQAQVPSTSAEPLLIMPGGIREGPVWHGASAPFPHTCALITLVGSKVQTIYWPSARHNISAKKLTLEILDNISLARKSLLSNLMLIQLKHNVPATVDIINSKCGNVKR